MKEITFFSDLSVGLRIAIVGGYLAIFSFVIGFIFGLGGVI